MAVLDLIAESLKERDVTEARIRVRELLAEKRARGPVKRTTTARKAPARKAPAKK